MVREKGMNTKMSFWKTINYRWGEEELKKWSSFKKTAYLLLPLLLYFVVHDIAEFLLWAFMEMLIVSGGEDMLSFFRDNGNTLQGIIYGFAILLGVSSIWPAVKGEISGSAGRKDKSKSPKRDDAGRRAADANGLTAYLFLAALAFCTAVSLNIFFTQSGFTGSSETYEEIYRMQYGVQFAVGLVLYGFLSPLAEEAVFRGLLYNRMKRCFHYGIALLVSSLLFGVYHGNLVQAVYGSILGLLIACLYDQYESFAAPVLFHSVANASIYAMTYRNGLAQMDTKIALTMGTILFAAAVIIFLYIKKKLVREAKEG